MTTQMLAQPSRLSDEVQIEAVIAQARLAAAWNTLGEHDPHRLELVIDDRPVPILELSSDFSHACGVAIAAALLEHQGTACERWTVRVLAWDEQIGAWILVRDWRSNV